MPKRRHPPTELSWPNESGPWQVRVHWKEIDGRVECIGLELWHGKGGDARPITTTALRAINPRELIDTARLRYLRGLTRSADALDNYLAKENQAAGRGATKLSPYAKPGARTTKSPAGSPRTRPLRDKAQAVRRAPHAKVRRGRPPGRKYPADHWSKVTACYVEAQRQGFPPTAAVAAEFDVSHSTAAKWIARLRRMDPPLLPTTEKGKAKSW